MFQNLIPKDNDSKKNVNRYAPANLNHVYFIGKFLKRTINVWYNGEIIYYIKIGKKLPIDVEFSKNPASKIGHFSLKDGKEPYTKEMKIFNNCLFDVVAFLTGYKATKLRHEVEILMKQQRWIKKKQVDKYGENIVGGARYKGKSAKDAKALLDSCQSAERHPDRKSGHSRGHASDPSATGPYESVENYSRVTKSRKTGFLSRKDADKVAHLLLRTIQCKEAMELLNFRGENAKTEVVDVKADVFDETDLPMAQEWDKDGQKVSKNSSKIKSFTIVLCHYYDKYDDEKADVFVYTFYPRL